MKTKQDAEALLKASKSLLDRVQGDDFDFEKANKDLFELRSSINDLWKKSEISCQDMIHNAELKVLNIELFFSYTSPFIVWLKYIKKHNQLMAMFSIIVI